MPTKPKPKAVRTPPGKGLRVKIKEPWMSALRTSLRKKKPAEGWPTVPPAASEEE